MTQTPYVDLPSEVRAQIRARLKAKLDGELRHLDERHELVADKALQSLDYVAVWVAENSRGKKGDVKHIYVIRTDSKEIRDQAIKLHGGLLSKKGYSQIEMFELPSLHYRRAFPRGGLYGMNVSEPEPREAIRGDRLFESQSHNSLVVMLKNLKLGSESDDSRDRYRTRRMSYY